MRRFVTIPVDPPLLSAISGQTITLVDDAGNAIGPAACQWGMFVRAIFTDQALRESMDALDLIDLRAKLLAAKAGDVVELDEDRELAPLRPALRRPRTLSPDYLFSAAPHLRALLDAPSEDPRAAK